MRDEFKLLQDLTDQMQNAITDGRTQDFSRTQTRRHALLKEIAALPGKLSHDERFLIDSIREKDSSWLSHIRNTLDLLRSKINKSQHKRHSLGNISRAYVGQHGAGQFVYRRG